MAADNIALTLSDGRLLDVFDTGPAGAPTIVWLPGTPEGHRILASVETAATTAGLRIVTIARPGYARSSRLAGRTISDVVPDVIEVCDQLGITSFAAMGDSGGGPHALACGALAGGRCVAVASLAGVGPYAADGLDFLAGMGESNEIEFAAAQQGEATLRRLLEAWRGDLLANAFTRDAAGQVDPSSLRGVGEMFESLLSPPDLAVLDESFLVEFSESAALALSTGVDGWLDDDLAFVAPWGFAPGDVAVPTFVYQGGQDLMVPPAHGEWLAARLPNATVHRLPDDGHLTLLRNRSAEILAELAAVITHEPHYPAGNIWPGTSSRAAPPSQRHRPGWPGSAAAR